MLLFYRTKHDTHMVAEMVGLARYQQTSVSACESEERRHGEGVVYFIISDIYVDLAMMLYFSPAEI